MENKFNIDSLGITTNQSIKDSEIIRATGIYLYQKNSLSKKRLEVALMNLFWNSYPYKNFYDLILFYVNKSRTRRLIESKNVIKKAITRAMDELNLNKDLIINE